MSKLSSSKWFLSLGIFFSKFIPSGIWIPVFKGPLRGYRWIVGAAAGPAKGLSVTLNLLETKQLEMARKLAPANGICFDIGANVGLYSLLFARYSNHVFAFEPLPRNIRYLSRTLAVNKIKNATIVPWAVSDTRGLLSFQEGENWSLGRLNSTGGQPVSTVSCDDFVSIYGVVPSLLKIDVEGAEDLVLKGAKNLLIRHKPIILLSTHNEAVRTDCLTFLKNLDYNEFIPLSDQEFDEATEFAIIP